MVWLHHESPLRAAEGYSRGGPRHKVTTKVDGRKDRRVSSNGDLDTTWDYRTAARPLGIFAQGVCATSHGRRIRNWQRTSKIG